MKNLKSLLGYLTHYKEIFAYPPEPIPAKMQQQEIIAEVSPTGEIETYTLPFPITFARFIKSNASLLDKPVYELEPQLIEIISELTGIPVIVLIKKYGFGQNNDYCVADFSQKPNLFKTIWQ